VTADEGSAAWLYSTSTTPSPTGLGSSAEWAEAFVRKRHVDRQATLAGVEGRVHSDPRRGHGPRTPCGSSWPRTIWRGRHSQSARIGRKRSASCSPWRSDRASDRHTRDPVLRLTDAAHRGQCRTRLAARTKACFSICLWPSCGCTKPERERRRLRRLLGGTLADARRHDLAAVFEPIDARPCRRSTSGTSPSRVRRQPIKGWFHGASDPGASPFAKNGRLPCVVGVHRLRAAAAAGRSTGSCQPSAGHAISVMDVRGQGSSWRAATRPTESGAGDRTVPGFVTRGILEPATYYYRRLLNGRRSGGRGGAGPSAGPIRRAWPSTAAARAAGWRWPRPAWSGPAADPDRRAVHVPLAPRTEITDGRPVSRDRPVREGHRDQAERVFQTLSYFDGSISPRGPSLRLSFSVALMAPSARPPRSSRVQPLRRAEGDRGLPVQTATRTARRIQVGAQDAPPGASGAG